MAISVVASMTVEVVLWKFYSLHFSSTGWQNPRPLNSPCTALELAPKNSLGSKAIDIVYDTAPKLLRTTNCPSPWLRELAGVASGMPHAIRPPARCSGRSRPHSLLTAQPPPSPRVRPLLPCRAAGRRHAAKRRPFREKRTRGPKSGAGRRSLGSGRRCASGSCSATQMRWKWRDCRSSRQKTLRRRSCRDRW